MKTEAINDTFSQQCRSVGGPPARLYGLAKVHKKDVLLCPIVSTPGCVYDILGNVLAPLLGRLPEAKTACNTNRVASRLRKINLLPDEKLVSLYVTSLLTMVPLHETVTKTVTLLAETGVNDGICNQNTI